MPKLSREDEESLDASDIRKILLSCNNRRLKTYLLVLASGGMRAVEGLAIRLKDITTNNSYQNILPDIVMLSFLYMKTSLQKIKL
jgi:integrase